MTTEFANFVVTQDAKNTIQLNVRKYTLMLCDAIKLNYIEYCIKHHKRAISKGNEIGSYHKDAIEELKNGICDYDFYIEEGGRKYYKIVMNTGNQLSVHAFVDKKTGEVYKPASFKSPAKHVRYNLLIIQSREECFERADWAGGYLYM
tara:strand:+ start:359 stop:802 length:444 start_codon:yes stop_codon:yes gene_type:complete